MTPLWPSVVLRCAGCTARGARCRNRSRAFQMKPGDELREWLCVHHAPTLPAVGS